MCKMSNICLRIEYGTDNMVNSEWIIRVSLTSKLYMIKIIFNPFYFIICRQVLHRQN